MLRSLFLFLHVTSAMGVFAALGVEAVVLVLLRRAANAADVSTALQGFRLVPPVGGLSLAGTLLTGVYLATTVWRWQGAWIGLGFAGMLLTAVIGATTTGRRIPRLAAAASEAARAAPTTRSQDLQRDPVLWASFQARVALLTGIVFLMTVKPSPTGSLVVMAIAIAVGLVAGFMSRRVRAAAR
jgi:hypothetical protein